jgi:ribose/xylose/arabinose/galactoside ABC-type transport system permease subunit
MARIWIIPVPVIFLFVMTAFVMILVRKSLYGRWLYAVGTNARTARVSGIPTDRVIFGTYVLSGFFAGMAAIIVTARLESASVTMGPDSFVLDIVSSAVVGGVSIYGGVGSPMGAVIGALIITLISNSMNMMRVSYFYTLLFKGCIIILAVALDALRKQ